MEEWRVVEGFIEYEVSNMGNVRRDGKVLKSIISNNGYMIIGLYTNSTCKTKTIHKLVALAFIPNPDNKLTIDHIDRNKLNNRVENLRWATYSEQNINSFYPNIVGHRHISIKRKSFIVQITRDKVKIYRKCFNTLPEAISARDAFLATL
jgi:hypothetical protein